MARPTAAASTTSTTATSSMRSVRARVAKMELAPMVPAPTKPTLTMGAATGEGLKRPTRGGNADSQERRPTERGLRGSPGNGWADGHPTPRAVRGGEGRLRLLPRLRLDGRATHGALVLLGHGV